MFKLTEKAKKFNSFIIHSCEAAVTDYSTYESEKAVWEAVKDEQWVAEEIAEGNKIEIIELLFISSLAVFTADEMIYAAEDGYNWPLVCGYVEEVDDDEENIEDDIAFDEENLESIDEELLKKCIKLVEEDSDWGDWLNGEDVIEQYAPGEWCDDVEWVLNRAVESNGESLKEDLPMIERQLFGRNMSGSFYDR